MTFFSIGASCLICNGVAVELSNAQLPDSGDKPMRVTQVTDNEIIIRTCILTSIIACSFEEAIHWNHPTVSGYRANISTKIPSTRWATNSHWWAITLAMFHICNIADHILKWNRMQLLMRLNKCLIPMKLLRFLLSRYVGALFDCRQWVDSYTILAYASQSFRSRKSSIERGADETWRHQKDWEDYSCK